MKCSGGPYWFWFQATPKTAVTQHKRKQDPTRQYPHSAAHGFLCSELAEGFTRPIFCVGLPGTACQPHSNSQETWRRRNPGGFFPSSYQAVALPREGLQSFSLRRSSCPAQQPRSPRGGLLDGSSSQGRARLQLFLLSVLSDCDFSLREIYIK